MSDDSEPNWPTIRAVPKEIRCKNDNHWYPLDFQKFIDELHDAKAPVYNCRPLDNYEVRVWLEDHWAIVCLDSIYQKVKWRGWLKEQQQKAFCVDQRVNFVEWHWVFVKQDSCFPLHLQFGSWCVPHIMIQAFGYALLVGWYWQCCNIGVKANGFSRHEWKMLGMPLSGDDVSYFSWEEGYVEKYGKQDENVLKKEE